MRVSDAVLSLTDVSCDNEEICLCVCFFFQAEDGIRDLVRSRGLGDVYKRQVENEADPAQCPRTDQPGHPARYPFVPNGAPSSGTVSYTHLTLPTSDLV